MRAHFKAGLAITVDVDSSVAPQVNASFAAVVLDQLDVSEQLTGETTPDLQGEPVDLSTTLIANAGTIDLTAAPIAYRIASTYNLTGKRLIAMILSAPEDNAGTITVATGASNGYPLGTITLEPGEVASIGQINKVSTRAPVAAGDKILDVSGTGTDSVKILAVFGDA
jgi:hypothetical protein